MDKMAFIYHHQGETYGDRPPSYDELSVMNSDGSGRTGLTFDPTNSPYFPAWSPDGCLAFTVGNQRLMTISEDGRNQSLLAEKIGSFSRPAWSLDGKKIAVAADMGDGAADIYLVNVDGTGLTRLTIGGGKEYLAWSPDGKKIAFNWAEPGAAFASIYVMDADGSGVTNLSNVPATTGNDTEPAWSPDGHEIAFTAARNVLLQIYLMNVDGSGQTQLTSDTGNEPGWSAEGTKILWHGYRGGQHAGAIWIMNADGSGQQQLSTLSLSEASGQQEGDMWPAWSPKAK